MTVVTTKTKKMNRNSILYPIEHKGCVNRDQSTTVQLMTSVCAGRGLSPELFILWDCDTSGGCGLDDSEQYETEFNSK